MKEVDAPVEDQLDKHALIENIESLSDKISTNQSVQHEVFADDSGLEEFQLVAPSVLLKKTQYHPLHIFVSVGNISIQFVSKPFVQRALLEKLTFHDYVSKSN